MTTVPVPRNENLIFLYLLIKVLMSLKSDVKLPVIMFKWEGRSPFDEISFSPPQFTLCIPELADLA